ncbi:MAG: Coenzyme F420 hydrogenase/dehydrogenase, beta subunit C-terminal domain [Lachnospiraceae bacterium]
MKTENKIRCFCTGCGLCHSVCKEHLMASDKGFVRPSEVSKKWLEFYANVCPGIKGTSYESAEDIWGYYQNVWLGYAANQELRYQCSSGGVLSAVGAFLLNKQIVNGVIHVAAAKNSVYQTEVYCSRSEEEIIHRCGSRYAISSPLKSICEMLIPGEKYAFIGKPCDVFSLKQYMKQSAELREAIILTLSFFCAGIPSDLANKELITKLTGDWHNCSKLIYRGRGWPGEAIAVDHEGAEHRMSYEESWGRILGRDVSYFCRFCVDGIGERADISCGDAWYCDENKKPDFTDRPGRNVVFARSSAGAAVIKNAQRNGYIKLEPFEEKLSELKYMQPYQWSRKGTMLFKVIAMKLMCKPIPAYSYRVLLKWQKNIGFSQKCRTLAGTIKRVLTGRI